MEYLVFQLHGPMASWGEIAVGQDRHSATHPSKSAVLGILAAALGVKRHEEDKLEAMSTGYQEAIKVISVGFILKDYHTVQVPRSSGNFRYATRRDELVHGCDQLGTLLSTRDYRAGAEAVVAIKADAGAPYPLFEVQEALKKPKFHLYLGRKSCPLAVPMQPQLLQAESFRQALDGFVLKALPLGSVTASLNAGSLHYYWEGKLEDFDVGSDDFDPASVQSLTKYDEPVSRTRWQFTSRVEQYWSKSEEVS